MTVLDVGAHIGYYTRLFSELAGPGGQVLAFEPERENYAVLGSNVEGLGNVQTFDVAASDSPARLNLYVSPGSTNHSLIEGFSPAERVEEVQAIDLDSFLDAHGIKRVDFVKIDIEGAEPRALAGMARTIGASAGMRLLIEYNPAALRLSLGSPEKLLDHLEALGFRVEEVLSDEGPAEIPPVDSSQIVNLFCRRK